MSQLPLKSQNLNIRFRQFQDKDGESVRKVYLTAMLTGANSPAYQAQKTQLNDLWSAYFYVQAILGALLAFGAYTVAVRLGGAILIVSAPGLLYGRSRNIDRVFQQYTMDTVKGDLAEVHKSYSAPGSAFWVAEIASGINAGQIIGCAGLDSSVSTDTQIAELRRMAVLPEFQGQRIGTRLLSAMISHARESGLATIMLNTSMYQTAAISMYEAAGFREVNRVEHSVKFLFVPSSATLHFFEMSM